MSTELVNKSNTAYRYIEYGGNHLGVELLTKQIRAEYLVR